MLLVPGRGRDVLVDLINSSNPLPLALTSDTVFLGDPKVLASPPGGVAVVVVPLVGGRYAEQVEVQYQRMDLTGIFGGYKPIIEGLGTSNLHTMLDVINEALGTSFEPRDVEDVEIDWLKANNQVNLPIKATPKSYGYFGSFIVQFNRERSTLADKVKVNSLDLFNYKGTGNAVGRSLEMVTWGLDFSEDLAALEINRYGQWTQLGKLAAILQGLGFADFPQVDFRKNPVGDYATSEVPSANPRFERVAIHRDVVTAGYRGTAYFHYNRA